MKIKVETTTGQIIRVESGVGTPGTPGAPGAGVNIIPLATFAEWAALPVEEQQDPKNWFIIAEEEPNP
ncbi:MAG: hypothetical protein ACNA8L_10250 [Luteolibacter sp.]